MPDPIYPNLRIAPSGPSVQGTVGFVLTKTADGVQFQPPAAGGSVTPLSAVKTVDASSVAGSPTGGWSQSVAYPGLQAAIDALEPFGGTLYVAAGDYSADITIDGESIASVEIIGLAYNPLQPTPVISGQLIGTGTDTNPFVTLRRLKLTGLITGDGGQWNFWECVSTSNVTGAGVLFARNSSFGDCTTTSLDAQDSVFSQTLAVSSSAFLAQHCTFSGVVTAAVLASATGCAFTAAVTCNASGISKPIDCTFSAAVQFDQCNATGCTFANVTGASDGTLLFRDSLIAGTVDVPLSWDATTERRSLSAGIVITGDFVLALSSGQGGPAKIVTGTTTLDFATPVGPTNQNVSRGIILRNLAANATVTLDENGGAALQPFYLDCWHTAHTVTVKDSGGTTIDTIAANAAGNGTRSMYQIDDTTGLVVKTAPRAAL